MEENDRKYMWFSEIQRVDVNWLWYPYIPYGKISVLQGDPGCGKSMLMVDLISCITTGRFLPGYREAKEPINVIYQCSEDGLADTIIPRLESAKADCSRVACINEDLYDVTLENDIMKQAITDLNAKMLVIDPFQAYLGESDLSSALGMRRVLKKLGFWAEKYNCAVVLVGHLNKKSGQKELYRGLGSVDIMALSRSVMQLERSDENCHYRLLKHIKASLTGLANDLLFEIDESGKLKWSSENICGFKSVNPFDGLVPEGSKITTGKSGTVARMILQALSKGQVPAKTIIDSITKMNISDRTIKNVKASLNIDSVRKDGIWYWQLPDSNKEDK